MGPARFSLRCLMAVVGVLAVGFALLHSPSALTASLAYSAMVVVLLGAMLGLLLARRPGRAAWLGFNVFGWGYFAIAFVPRIGTEITPANVNASSDVNPHLIMTRLFDALYARTFAFPTNEFRLVTAQDPITGGSQQYAAGVLWRLQRSYYLRIGHSWAGLLFAFVGAALPNVLAGRAEIDPL